MLQQVQIGWADIERLGHRRLRQAGRLPEPAKLVPDENLFLHGLRSPKAVSGTTVNL